MPSNSVPNNPLTKRAQKWKHDQRIISLTLDELKKEVGDKKFIAEQKVDGQSAIMEYKDGQTRFASLHDQVITKIPVLDEIESILKKNKIKSALMVGELAGVEDGKIIHFDKTESLIKNPAKDKEALHWFPYQILELNGEEYGEGFETYMKGWPLILKFFKGANHIEPVEHTTSDIQGAWNKYVEKQGNEGLVVRTDNNRVYKAKPTYTYDLVVLAVGDKKAKNWPKKMIGTTLMAFMDSNHIFRVAGEIGTGWTFEERRELFACAQKNKVDEDDTYVWVKPKRIMELQWERSNIRDGMALKYFRGKYEKMDKRPVGSIVKPRFLRYRTDKSVNPTDLRLTQIPNWEKAKRMAMKVAATWIKKTICSGKVSEAECPNCKHCFDYNSIPESGMGYVECPKCKKPVHQGNLKKSASRRFPMLKSISTLIQVLAVKASKLKGFVTDIEKDTVANDNFRKVLYTGKNSQLVLMSLKPGEDIGEEIHDDTDQFFRVDAGSGQVVINGVKHKIKNGSAIVIPQGARHNIINTGKEPLRLYSIYSPAHHRDGVIHKTKEDAEKDTEEHFDGKTTE